MPDRGEKRQAVKLARVYSIRLMSWDEYFDAG
jgi:hypothetical protein